MTTATCHSQQQAQRRVLAVALTLNALMFLAEAITGWSISSTALLADSLDMFADAAVYGLSWYAVGRSAQLKAQAATVHAISHLLLALLLLAEVVRCTLQGAVPAATPMSVLAILALLVNTSCLLLLQAHRGDDINLRASWLCSRNDLIGNVAVLAAAILVSYYHSAWPDRIVGLTMAALMLHSAAQIGRAALPQLRRTMLSPARS